MTKIKELSTALLEARAELRSRQESRVAFAEEFVQRLGAHLGSRESIRYMPSGEKRPKEAIFSASAAMAKGPGAFWDLGLELLLPGEPSGFPFSISFAPNGDQFTLALPPERISLNNVRLGNDAGFEPFFNAVVDRLKDEWMRTARNG